MGARKPTLDEWFLHYQMQPLARKTYVNGYLHADVSAIDRRARERGVRPAWTAVAIKALALTAREVPEINRAYLPSPLGDRVVEFDHVSVNVPILLQTPEGDHLIGSTVRDADVRSVADIRAFLRAEKSRPLEDTRVAKHLARRPNTLVWRTMLRGLHFASFRLGLFARYGGGLSVSSILSERTANLFHMLAKGPTAATLLVTNLRRDQARVTLECGLAFDHGAVHGRFVRRTADCLHDLLQSESDQGLARFD